MYIEKKEGFAGLLLVLLTISLIKSIQQRQKHTCLSIGELRNGR
jgi:hypothetical protein